MKTFLPFSLFVAMATLICAQSPPLAAQEQTAAGVRTTKETAAAVFESDQFAASLIKIRSELPDLQDYVINCDKTVIENSLPVVMRKFRAMGFDTDDATQATLNGWENVRLTSALPKTKCMVTVSFQEYVNSLGRMHFRSSPTGAAIELNAKPLNQSTDSKRWFEPKEYRVKYSKPDCCLPVETTCTVTESAETDCFAELPKKP